MQDWDELFDYERDASGLHHHEFVEKCQPHKHVITAHWKSKFYLRLPVWSARPESDMTAMDRGEDPYLVSTYQIFEFFCQADSPDWALCKTIVRLALAHADALASQEPFHEVGSTGPETLDRVFGPVGTVRVFRAEDMDRLDPSFIRNLFGTHHLLVVPPADQPEPPSFNSEGFDKAYLRESSAACDIHCELPSCFNTSLSHSSSLVLDDRDDDDFQKHIRYSSLRKMAKFVDEGLKEEAKYADNPEGCIAVPAMNCLAVTMQRDAYSSRTFTYVVSVFCLLRHLTSDHCCDSVLAECFKAYSSTCNLDISSHHGIPDNLYYWGIASTRGCIHHIHIDGAGLNTRMHCVSGFKLFLVGQPKNASSFSWNPHAGHSLVNILDKLLWQLVVIPPGAELYVQSYSANVLFF